MTGKVLKIREIGDPVLQKVAAEVEIKKMDQEIVALIQDLKATLAFGSGFGIAAPQVGESKRIVVIEVKNAQGSYKEMEEVACTAMINPEWKPLAKEMSAEFEGCLSVPSIRGKVERYKQIEVSYTNEKGKRTTKQVKGFLARLIQHECDHLEGVVFTERVTKKDGFATKQMIEKFKLK